MKKEFDWATLDGILQFGATKGQCASILLTSEDTIDRRIHKFKGMTFEAYKETKLGLTKVKLQQKAIKMALDGHATMLIFSLKNLCGWTDRQDIKVEDNRDVLLEKIKKAQANVEKEK
jgi:hypothetical protein